ncbi:MAG: hypothetical protein Q7T73_09410, partial [Beijerinckiaceae bacterium]|nr:hypothetical protein [Beijerinckiaceae bacterium]
AIIRAAQQYGMIVRDTTASSVALYAEMSQNSYDPYARPSGVFGKYWPDQIMRSFPWEHLEVVTPGA